MSNEIHAAGEYAIRITRKGQKPGKWEVVKNLVVNEGLAHILNVAFGQTPKPAGYYVALFGGAAAPAANWTAATFPSAAGEIVSMSEGYTAATRPQWTPPANVTTPTIDNFTTVASVTIATAGALNVTGAALLTNATRGGTTGTLISATKFPAVRTFQDGDRFDIGYRISLTV
jgi:hypothetical protein